MSRSRTRRLVACTMAIGSLLAVGASAASAGTLINPFSTSANIASSNFTFTAMQGYAPGANVTCAISGGTWAQQVQYAASGPVWFNKYTPPGVSCPGGQGGNFVVGSSTAWDLGGQASASGPHVGKVTLPAFSVAATVGTCGNETNWAAATITGDWINGAGAIDSKIRFGATGASIPVQYVRTNNSPACDAAGPSGPRTLVIHSGSEWKIHNAIAGGGAFIVSFV